MLKITVPEQELFDENKNEFVTIKSVNLTLEHSLVSISKWEAIYFKPFITSAKTDDKTPEEVLKYIECMTITQNVDPRIYKSLDRDSVAKIKDYIASPLSATTFTNRSTKAPSREVITSELIYYWMTAYNIPFECEKWPIQRLLNLIKICSIKNDPNGSKKMSKKDLMTSNAALNAARRAKSGSRG